MAYPLVNAVFSPPTFAGEDYLGLRDPKHEKQECVCLCACVHRQVGVEGKAEVCVFCACVCLCAVCMHV